MGRLTYRTSYKEGEERPRQQTNAIFLFYFIFFSCFPFPFISSIKDERRSRYVVATGKHHHRTRGPKEY